MKKVFFIIISLFVFHLAFSQRAKRQQYKDSAYHFMVVGAHIEGQLPFGDLSKRFGSDISAGMPVLYKTAKGLIFGVEGNVFFSNNVKEDPLDYMYNDNNTISDANGNPATLRLNERGFSIYAEVGKIIPCFTRNKNSGCLFMFGAGYMQHKISITDVGKSMPQVFGNLKKGYDRLSGGPALNQFIGYMFYAKNRIVNFYAGIDLQEGFTTGLRGWQYDTGKPDNQKRMDILAGIRFGWLLPLYKKAPKEFYFN